jgi:hypothetical protein
MRWVLDMVFKDALSRYRSGNGAKNMAGPPLLLQSHPSPQGQGKHQNQAQSRWMGSSLPPRNPATKMSVNLDSEPWLAAGPAPR